MSGSAILDPEVLVDDLVELTDDLRGDLHPEFGVRAYNVSTVHRVWPGPQSGQGVPVITEVLFDPQPRVSIWDSRHYELDGCGLDDIGTIKLTEVSLTYTQAELDGGGALGRTEDWFLKLTEAHGQGSRSAYFSHTRPPFVDREKNMGWVCWLRKVAF